MMTKTNRPLHILMIAPTSFFGHYGGHIRILEETHVLQAMGHKVTIVTYHIGNDLGGIDIRRTPALPYRSDYEVGSSRHKLAFDVLLSLKSLQVAWQIKPDIIHGHMHEGALIGGVLARLWRVPLVFDFQGSLTGEMLDHDFLDKEGAVYPWVHRLEQFISARLPGAVLTSSTKAKALLENEFQVPPSIVHPLPDCANFFHFNPDNHTESEKQTTRTELEIPSNVPIIACLGLLADYQGTHHLVMAAKGLKDAGISAHFLIMGYPNVAHYQALADELGVTDCVTFTGRVDYQHNAPRFLALGDIAISAKISATEGAGKVLNYMALKQPIVAYDTLVHREYLGDWGTYAPKGDVEALTNAIRLLLENPDLRKKRGEALYQRAKQMFSWKNAGKQIETIYYQLLN